MTMTIKKNSSHSHLVTSHGSHEEAGYYRRSGERSFATLLLLATARSQQKKYFLLVTISDQQKKVFCAGQRSYPAKKN